MSRYRLRIDGESTEHVVEGKSPAKALRELCSQANLALLPTEDKPSRYGKALVMYSNPPKHVHVMAATEPWTRRRLDPLERTTRV